VLCGERSLCCKDLQLGVKINLAFGCTGRERGKKKERYVS
jgi:hypothetical protein